ncbi:MAG TPA: glycosyl transferase, partial [Sporomusaceae bacterium]|nr:glycosyl transferase [Sporomusaceae bacterium]
MDFLFLVDSDLALHPQTITHLVGLNKKIVSEVYWTKWEQNFPPLPQVWAGGQYRLHEVTSEKTLSPEQIALGQQIFLSKLHCPGVYKVGGLGACTLISKTALDSGISFSKVYNL